MKLYRILLPTGLSLLLSGCSFNLLGGLNLEASDPETEALARAVRLNPENAHAWYMSGREMLENGEYRQAERSFELAVDEMAGFEEAWLGLALARRERGDAEGADEALRQILFLNDRSVSARIQLAGMALEEERLDDAKRLAAEALKIQPTSQQAARILGEVAYIRGDYRTAMNYWERIGGKMIDDRRADLRIYLDKYPE